MLNKNSLKFKKVLPTIMIYAVMVVMALVANLVNPGFLSVDNVYALSSKSLSLALPASARR